MVVATKATLTEVHNWLSVLLVSKLLNQSVQKTDQSSERPPATQRRRADTRDKVSAYRTCAPARRGQEHHSGCTLHGCQRQEVLRGNADGMVRRIPAASTVQCIQALCESGKKGRHYRHTLLSHIINSLPYIPTHGVVKTVFI